MSDSPTTVGLLILIQSSSDSIHRVHLPLLSPPPSTHISLLRTDLLSILALLYQSVTKLSLALNPSSPSYSASIAPLKDASDRVIALSHSVRLFTPSHGLTFIREAKSLVVQILESVRSLAQTFLDNDDNNNNNNRSASGRAGDEYMIRTAAVHDLIDKARSSTTTTDGLSIDNVSAVRKLWLHDQASLDDGFNELMEMIDSNDAGEGDVVDDGWDELGLETKKMSVSEVERAKKAQAILRFSTVLHKRIGRDLLSSTYHPTEEFNPYLDALPQHSSALLVASDELVASMYSPQNAENISADLVAFKAIVQNLQSPIVPLLEQKDAKLKLWFTTCFEQVLKAVGALSDQCASVISPSSLSLP